jgi:protein-S-isoprenylcysteine O-methyltransferase Ste14
MPSSESSSPGVHVPPPLVYATGLALGLWMSAWIPSRWLPAAVSRAAGWALTAAALGLATPSFYRFFRARTTVLPDRPASSLITSGPYRFTRNPLYVSMTLLYLGVAVLYQCVWALPLLVLVVLYIDRRVIRPEERYLERRFGADYTRYCANVRRWI